MKNTLEKYLQICTKYIMEIHQICVSIMVYGYEMCVHVSCATDFRLIKSLDSIREFAILIFLSSFILIVSKHQRRKLLTIIEMQQKKPAKMP